MPMSGHPLLRCTAAAAAVLFSLSAQAQLPEIVASKMAANNIPPDAISALVLRGDAPLVSYLADRPMQPARSETSGASPRSTRALIASGGILFAAILLATISGNWACALRLNRTAAAAAMHRSRGWPGMGTP